MATAAARPSPNAPAAPKTGRRGRPTAERAAAIDAAIRGAARDLFIKHGFEAASMDAIAAKARVSKGTLYARYDSKEPLFRAILEGEIEGLGKLSAARETLAEAFEELKRIELLEERDAERIKIEQARAAELSAVAGLPHRVAS